MKWHDAVKKAINRHCRSRKSNTFTRKDLIKEELHRIVSDAISKGNTPSQTLSRVLQELRAEGEIAFIKRGVYKKLK